MGNHLVYSAGELHRTATAAMTPGDIEVIGNRIGMVSGMQSIAIGDSYALQTIGIAELAALSTDVWADGDILYWDDINLRLTDTAGILKSAGIADGAKAAASAVARVDLNASVASTTI